MEQIDVEMDNVEFFRTLPNLIDDQHEMGNGVAHCRIEPERATGTGE